MKLKFVLWAILQYDIVVITSPSIVGLTYRDNFDFEQRFRDVNECNPFHWHPLHLPEMCADLFEKLIRSKLGKRMPLRVVVDRQQHPEQEPRYGQPHWPEMTYRYNENAVHYYPNSYYPDYSQSIENYDYINERPETDYERVLEQLKKDIARNPSEGEIGVVPNVGPALIYKQEVSKKSEDMIKNLGSNYARVLEKLYSNTSKNPKLNDSHLYVWDSRKNETKASKKNKNKKKNKRRFNRKRYEENGLITIIETLEPESLRRRRSA